MKIKIVYHFVVEIVFIILVDNFKILIFWSLFASHLYPMQFGIIKIWFLFFWRYKGYREVISEKYWRKKLKHCVLYYCLAVKMTIFSPKSLAPFYSYKASWTYGTSIMGWVRKKEAQIFLAAVYTVCPRSSGPFYIVSYYIK